MKEQIEQANGKLGVLIPGLGAVLLTMIAGVEAVKKAIGKSCGFAHANGQHPSGQAHGKPLPQDQGFCILADLNDIVFGGWDV